MFTSSIKFTQRYYHFIAFQGNKAILPGSFLKAWKLKEKKCHEFKDFAIHEYKLTSSIQYYRGDFDNSKNQDNSPPYEYDVILIECISSNLFILGFPFKRMTLNVINSLESVHQIARHTLFLKANMGTIIRAFDRHTDLLMEGNRFFLAGVYLSNSIQGNTVSSVQLSGDKPLDSDLYINYFKDSLEQDGDWKLVRYVLKCSNVEFNSTIQVDKFGNFKMYVPVSGRSILSVPYFFGFLNKIEGLISTENNPVRHILDDEK